MYKRALVPLDGSVVAEGVVPFVLEIAGPLDMEVTLLRVVVPTPPVIVEGSSYVAVDDLEQQEADADAYLAGIAAELRAKGIRVKSIVRRGEPVAAILNGAREVDADLIAMTTHGRSGFGRLLFGSVAEAVLRHSRVPVLLMRQTAAEVAARAAAFGGAR
jgi:nucleotide-binding universal stress UspA family protein